MAAQRRKTASICDASNRDRIEILYDISLGPAKVKAVELSDGGIGWVLPGGSIVKDRPIALSAAKEMLRMVS